MPVDNQDALTEEFENALVPETKDDDPGVEVETDVEEESAPAEVAPADVDPEPVPDVDEVDGLGVEETDEGPIVDEEDEEDEEAPASEEEGEPASEEDSEDEAPADEEKSETETTETTDESDEEIKGGRRVVMVPVEVEEEDEKGGGTNDLAARRSQLLAELAELNAQMNPEKEMDEDEDDEWKKRRRDRLVAMGYKDDEIDAMPDDAILCAVEQKVLSTDEPCAFCRGGCAREGKSAPGLLDIEAQAQAEYKGTILGSAYSPASDMFVVDIKTEDDRTIEAFYSGQGTAAGWVLLDQEMAARIETEGKDALAGTYIISMNEAEEIALKSLEGVSVGVDASVFEGYDAWAVQVEGIDGKSYDAFVGLDGTLLGYDEYEVQSGYNNLTPEEVAEVKAIEAELYFKREFSGSRREELAKEGAAMPDGSFPIVNETDLKNAIQAIGRAKNPDLAKAHIMKRAAQLGKEDLIPDSWKSADENVEIKTDDATFLKNLADFQAISLGLDD